VTKVVIVIYKTNSFIMIDLKEVFINLK